MKEKFDVAGYQVSLEDGLTPRQFQPLLAMLSDYDMAIPLCVSENNTTAIVFISETAFRKGWEEEEIYYRIAEIINDRRLENEEGIYEFEGDSERKPLMFYLGYAAHDFVSVTYISVWDGNPITSTALFEINTGEVLNIEAMDIPNGYKTCERVFIRLPNGDEYDVEHASDGSFAVRR